VNKFLVIFLAVLAAVVVTSTVSAEPPQARFFFAPLSGDEEVPPRDTSARGVALFADQDGEEIEFKIVVGRIENVFAAHIHCGPAGVNGPVGVTLFMGTPGGGSESGILESGTITSPDPGNDCDWLTLEDVLAEMRAGSTYTNVHTNDGIAPPNTGPGDFPGGEIRGQNRALP
jgi:CHRD domain